jgi:hypothetical protein
MFSDLKNKDLKLTHKLEFIENYLATNTGVEIESSFIHFG